MIAGVAEIVIGVSRAPVSMIGYPVVVAIQAATGDPQPRSLWTGIAIVGNTITIRPINASTGSFRPEGMIKPLYYIYLQLIPLLTPCGYLKRLYVRAYLNSVSFLVSAQPH